MKTKAEFCAAIATKSLTHVERAIALLWFYKKSQLFEERTASELASDLHEDGFPRPNVTQFRHDLAKSRYTISGRRTGTFQIDIRREKELDGNYWAILGEVRVDVSDEVIPKDFVSGTRLYLEEIVHQINGAYDNGFYDACAVLCRRLMESLIIEVYISRSRQHEIQANGVFFFLDRLISYIRNDTAVTLGRNTPKTMEEMKQIGDTAAHDRTYITRKGDIDGIKANLRRTISDLLVASGIRV
jgi:Domain of unknown function (DUF4145)